MPLSPLFQSSHWYIAFTRAVFLLLLIAIVATVSGCVQPGFLIRGRAQPTFAAQAGTQRVIYVRNAQEKEDIEARQIAAMRAAAAQMCSASAMRAYPDEQRSAYQVMCGQRTVSDAIGDM